MINEKIIKNALKLSIASNCFDAKFYNDTIDEIMSENDGFTFPLRALPGTLLQSVAVPNAKAFFDRFLGAEEIK